MGDPQLAVGTADCPIFRIQQILKKDAIIRENWSELARGLGVGSERIEKFRSDMILDKITYSDVIFQILEVWVAKEGSEATLDALLQVVEGHCDADGIAEILRQEFKLDVKSGTPSHSSYSLPEKPGYYIGRILLTRNIISSGIFQYNSPDIFLFKGMSRSDLAKLVKDKITGDSKEQLRLEKIDARFIILKQDSHFDRICGKTSNPVHLLRRERDGRLRWIRSKGNMAHLQAFVDHSQNELDEESFCRSLDSLNSPVCISDSPGMGKSILLAEIGRKLTVMYPNRIICFIMLTELIKLVKQVGLDDKITSVAKTLGTLSGNARHLPRESNSEEIATSFELLLDGLDEVDAVDHNLAYELLKIIQNSFKYIRLWITSRPHLLQELESHLNQLGYNIRPFQMDDQIQFLSSYWSRKEQLDQDKIHQFAKHCLEALKSKLNSTDQDIAGIPLQCLLIGESYEEDAVEYGRLNEDANLSVEIEIGTIANLYRNLIQKKIDKFESTEGEDKLSHREIMIMHARHSLDLIFSDHLDNLKLSLGSGTSDTMLKVGILEASSTSKSPRFLHRTFAEYFVAWLATDELKNVMDTGRELPKLFLHVLGTQAEVEMELYSFIFKYPVIAYFLDSLIQELVHHPEPVTNPVPSLDSMQKIAHACINGNHTKIFKFFQTIKGFNPYAIKIFDHKFIFLAIRNSSLELVRCSIHIYERHHQFQSHAQIEILRTAVKRGNFSVLEFFLIEKKLRWIVENLPGEASELIHDCIENSKNCSQAEIEQRVYILRMLVGINPSLLEVKGGLWKESPLLSFGVHVRFLEELIALGAAVDVQGIGGDTVLHMNYSRTHLTSKDYHDLVLCIPTENLRKLVNVKGEGKTTPLMTILRWIDPTPDTLLIFKEAGASFKDIDANEDSVIEIAIRNGRSNETTKMIIENGGKINRKPLQRLSSIFGLQRETKGTKTLLHHAAENGNLQALELLLEDKLMDVNVKDEDGMTPLDFAIRSCNEDGQRLDVGLILKERGGSFTEDVTLDGKSLLHIAAEKGNLQSVQLLIHLEEDVNLKDRNGNTALHLVANNKKDRTKTNNFYIAQALLDAGANPKIPNDEGMTPFAIAVMAVPIIFKRFLRDIASVKINFAVKFSMTRAEPWDDEQFILMSQMLVNELVDVNYQDSSGNSLLHIAALQGLWNAVRFLFTLGAEVNLKNNNGETALHFAAICRDKDVRLEVIMLLIENGADIYAKDKLYGSFIHDYVRSFSKSSPSKFFEMVLHLISNNLINIFTRRGDKDEATLLHFAVRYLEQDESTLELLHSFDADFNAVDSAGDSVLFYAVMGARSTKFISTLINQFGANPKHLNKQNWSLLHCAARHGTSDVLKYFLGLNISDINGLTAEGDTPLHTAPYFRSREMEVVKKCKLLIEHGADVSIRNGKGHTVAEIASCYCDNEDQAELAKLLQVDSMIESDC